MNVTGFDMARRGTAAVAFALLLLGCGDEDPAAEGRSPSGQDVNEQGGISARRSPALAWVGDRLVVYGGVPGTSTDEPPPTSPLPLGDAFLVDPGSGEVEVLPTPPVGPLESPAQLVVGPEQVFLFGVECDQELETSEDPCGPGTYAAAVLDLERRSWAEVEIPEELASVENGYSRAVGRTSTGDVVVTAGVPDSYVSSPFGKELWRYSLGEQRWQPLPDPGVRVHDACQTGAATVVLTSRIASDGGIVAEGEAYEGGTDAYVEPSVRVLPDEGADTWTGSELAPLSDWQAPPSVACSSDAIVLYGAPGEVVVAAVTSDGGVGPWRELGPLPVERAVFSEDVGSGDTVYLVETIGGAAVQVDTAEASWGEVLEMPAVDDHPVWTGTSVIGWPSGDPLGSSIAVESTP
jgi:hypothetical protein